MNLANKMTSKEKRSVISLSSIMALRMLGLFMVLPVFSLYAEGLLGATPTLIGLAMGIYGLSQALFQFPFGALSDHFGRKPIILIGLVLFILGSLMAGAADSIFTMIIGRSLQGIGAVGSTIMALMADHTREEQRTKAMAIAGITLGFSFSLAMLAGPLFTRWLAVNSLFFLAAIFGLLGILILYTFVPAMDDHHPQPETGAELKSFFKLLTSAELSKLNTGIFILHAIFTASFIIIPISLQQHVGLNSSQQWQLYLPTLLLAFIVCLIFINQAERKQQLKPYFLGGIAALGLSQLIMWSAGSSLMLAATGIGLFFAGFSLLEAFLPSLVSRTAPAERKGSALGLYSSAQFLGIFVGGLFGGWLYGQFSFTGVYLFCLILTLFWLALASFMQPPRKKSPQLDTIHHKEPLQSVKSIL